MSTSITIPYIGKYLKSSGLEVKLDGNAYYADLVQEKDMLIGFKDDKLKVAVALPEDDGTNMWFAVEVFCKTRSQFKEIIGQTFKLLLESVRTYINIREDVEESIRIKMMTEYMVSRESEIRPN